MDSPSCASIVEMRERVPSSTSSFSSVSTHTHEREKEREREREGETSVYNIIKLVLDSN